MMTSTQHVLNENTTVFTHMYDNNYVYRVCIVYSYVVSACSSVV